MNTKSTPKDYMVPVPRVIYYDCEIERYTITQPDNTHDYEVFDLVLNKLQDDYDNDLTNRKYYRNNLSQHSKYINPYDANQYTNTIHLDWFDWRSSLFHIYTDYGSVTDYIDIALNNAL